MYPETMRKAHKAMSLEEIEEMLKNNDYGILSMNTEDGYPYGVPVNYVYSNGKFIIHAANKGFRYENLKRDSKVCFTVVGKHDLLRKSYTTSFMSVIAYGDLEIYEDIKDKAFYLKEIINGLAKEFKGEGQKHIDGGISDVAIFVLTPKQMTGKKSHVDQSE